MRLTVDGEEFSQQLTVLKDPNTAGTAADIAEQVAFLEAVREDVVTAGKAIREVEVLRVQLQTLARFSEDEEVTEAVEELAQKLQDLQMEMVDLRLTGEGQDAVRFGVEILGKLGYLTRGVSVVDFPPTDQDIEVRRLLHDQLLQHLDALEAIVEGDLAALRALLQAKGLGGIVS